MGCETLRRLRRDVATLRTERETPKKAPRAFVEETRSIRAERFKAVRARPAHYPVALLCRARGCFSSCVFADALLLAQIWALHARTHDERSRRCTPNRWGGRAAARGAVMRCALWRA